ncbi:MAG TPA: MFS transporter [Thermoanaerobaculia bacterium]|jgi:AAA family ATP:ADP antiporter|nr:MFS transporter [Thermoanaerobaculia bacterium]
MRIAIPFVTFFSVLCGYFVLRPVRDEIGVRAGVESLPWLFTATFAATLLLVPLFGWIVSRVQRRTIAAATYALCSALLLATYAGLLSGGSLVAWGVGLFIGISVLNLFIISVFWSLMADSYAEADARKWYGIIAAGGTAGAIVGPSLTALLAPRIGPMNLLPISATFLGIAAILTMLIPRRVDAAPQQKIGGNVFAGILLALRSPTLRRIALIVICYTTISTIIYFEQADIVKKTIMDSGHRTRFFALLDLTNNTITVIVQLLITRQVLTRLGLRTALTAAPALIGTGLAALAFFPRLGIVFALQVIHRVGEHGFTRPGREVIYTVVAPEERFKAKNFIDTFVYRGNDALVAWLIGALHTAGAGTASIAGLGVLVAAGWAANGYTLGKKHDPVAT